MESKSFTNKNFTKWFFSLLCFNIHIFFLFFIFYFDLLFLYVAFSQCSWHCSNVWCSRPVRKWHSLSISHKCSHRHTISYHIKYAQNICWTEQVQHILNSLDKFRFFNVWDMRSIWFSTIKCGQIQFVFFAVVVDDANIYLLLHTNDYNFSKPIY